MPKNTRVLIPILDVEILNNIKYHKNTKSNNVFSDINKLNLEIAKINKKLSKSKLSNMDYNALYKLGLVTTFESDKLFKDVISIGRLISDRLTIIESKHNFSPKGPMHFIKSLEQYKDEILTNSIYIKCANLFADKYNCSILKVFDKPNKTLGSTKTNLILKPEEEFLVFCYRTYEMLLLFLGESIETRKISRSKDYYDNSFNELLYLEKYLSDYKDYDNLRFYLIKDISDNYFMALCSESIITPVIFALKNDIVNDGNTISKKYTVCKCCGNLFEATRKGQLFCFDKDCKKARNRHYKGY